MPYYQLLLISSSGALVLWIKATLGSKKIHGLGDVLETLLPDNPRAVYILQFLIFVFFGGYIGVLAVGPITQTHAFAGGVAWSRLAAKD